MDWMRKVKEWSLLLWDFIEALVDAIVTWDLLD